MASLSLSLVLGNDQSIYESFVGSLPPGEGNLKRGIVTPAHPANKPQTFQIDGVVPNIPYIVDIVGEWNTAPTPRLYFIPTTTFQLITLALPYGPVTITISSSNGTKFSEEYRAEGGERSITLTSILGVSFVTVDSEMLSESQWYLSQNQRTKRAELTFTAFPDDGAPPVVLAPKALVVISGVRASGVVESRQFLLSVTNYAVMFRAYAQELTEYSNQPLEVLRNSISSPLAYRLATPLLTKLTTLIPADLEILTSLSYKLLIKNLLHRPESSGAVREILAAFSASNPVIFKMFNLNRFDTPLYRSEEMFQGYEAHVWLPNKEVERWKAFITLLSNLPQLYTIKQITESEVYVEVGGRLKRHLFDFDSPLANSITTGVTYLSDCFLKLFSLGVTVESEHWLSFCQAAYVLDQIMLNALSPANDPIGQSLGLPAWRSYSLSGRFDQQYGITPVHEWYYDTPLGGVVDGLNKYFTLTKMPLALSAVKLFVDGLLKRLYVDYRVSVSGDIISGANRIVSSDDPILLTSRLGEPRPFEAQVFYGLEIRGGVSLQMLLTGVELGLDSVSFVISHQPNTIVGDPQNIAVHYLTPKLPNTANPGDNQYGSVLLDEGIISYDIVFDRPTLNLDYQLLVSFTVDPMPGSSPENVTQVVHLVRTHSDLGATVEFSAPIAANTHLNWWVIENDEQTIERGTVLLSEGDLNTLIDFTGGPYYDQVVVMIQLWHISQTYVPAPMYLTSFALNETQFLAMFSGPIESSGYRLDYCIFEARGGNFVEFYEAPAKGALIEAHYDANWKYWVNRKLTPPPDGTNTEFTLSVPCADPKSVYLTLDGRLMTQGADKQYIVSGNKVVFTFPPTLTQIPWAVYPVSFGDEHLPSSWDQGFLNRLPPSIGEYATGWIKVIGDFIVPGDSVTMGGVTFEATPTAEGNITNAKAINLGDSISWPSLHKVVVEGIDLATSAFTHVDHPFIDGLLVKIASTGTLPSGLSESAIYRVINSTLDEFNLLDSSDSPVVVLDLGTGIHTFTSQVTLTGVNAAPENYNQFKAGIGQDDDAKALVLAINEHPALSRIFAARYLGNGRSLVKAKSLGDGAYDMPMTYFGVSVSTSPTGILGDSVGCTYSSAIMRNKGYNVSIEMSEDNLDISTGTIKTIQGHRFLEGDGIKLATLGTLPEGLDAETIYYATGITSSSLQLRLRSTSAPVVIFTAVGSGTLILHSTEGLLALDAGDTLGLRPPLNVDFALSLFKHDDHGLFDGLKVTIINIGMREYTLVSGLTVTAGSLPGGLSEARAYYVVNATTDTFQLSASRGGLPVTLTSKGEGYQMLSVFPMEANSFSEKNHGFIEGEPVTLASEAPSLQGKKYIVGVSDNLFQVSAEVGGTPILFDDGGFEVSISSFPHFPSGNSQSLDASALAAELNKNSATKKLVNLEMANESTITVTSKQIGINRSVKLSVSGASMQAKDLSEGKDQNDRLLFTTSKLCYHYDAPIAALDGLSTRTWKQYGGDKFMFDNPPTVQQEGYFVSEVYPLDHHPLDTMVANMPECNYPKGVFAQGFCAHLTETEIPADVDASLVISTANMPIQEQPHPTLDPLVYELTLSSCRDQDSLMVWIDGIFQTPDNYSYDTLGDIGHITLAAPLTNSQWLWAWYLPMGSSCVYERVQKLTGIINGSNTSFGVPEVWADAETLMVFLEGLFTLQVEDYILPPSGGLEFGKPPALGQSLWAHYNLGVTVPMDRWRQVTVGVTNGTDFRYEIAHMLSSELPVSADATLVFLDGLNQGGKYTLEVNAFANPTGWIRFNDIPEAGRTISAAFIRATTI